MLGMGIIAVIAVGGLVCMVAGIAGGQEVVLAIVGFLVGYRARGTKSSRTIY
jgi:hypothetical protein